MEQLYPGKGGYLYGYARVSTEDQNLRSQMDALVRAGVPEDRIYTDKASGVAAKRKGLNECLRSMERGDMLVVASLDRLARSLSQLLGIVENLDKRGIGFKALNMGLDTSTPMGRFGLQMLGAVAEFERELIRERTRAGMASAKARGVAIGRKSISTPAKIEKAKEAIRAGMSFKDAAKSVGLAVSTLYRDIPGGAQSILEDDVDLPETPTE